MDTDQHPIEELDPTQCWTLLRRADVGRLAVSIMNKPDIFPVNFVVDEDSVVFRTAEGTKFAAAVLGCGVAFEVDGYEPEAGEAWSVVLKGHATEITDMYQLFDAADLPLFPWHAAPKHIFVRVTATEVTGRRFRTERAGAAKLL